MTFNLRFQGPRKTVLHHAYSTPLFINFRGCVFARCQHCRTLRRHSALVYTKVIVGRGYRRTDGVHVPKQGGRITYSEPKKMVYDKVVNVWLCERCR